MGEAYQVLIPTLAKRCESELVGDSRSLQQCIDEKQYADLASTWKRMGAQQQLLAEKKAGLIGLYHSSICFTSDSDEEYGKYQWTTSATRRWRQQAQVWETQKEKEWASLEEYLAKKKKFTPEWSPTWAVGRTLAMDCESPERWIPHDR